MKEGKQEAWRRLASIPLLKAVGIPLFIALFFAAYFAAAKHPFFAARIMPEWAIDRAIGIHPGWVWVYCSLWVYASLPASLLETVKSLVQCGESAAILAVAGLCIFFLWPTQVPAVAGGILNSVDQGRNACPSLHVAFALWACLRLDILIPEIAPGKNGVLRIASGAWCASIIYSTMATKQHVFVDVLFGTVLAGLAACVDRLVFGRRKRGKAALHAAEIKAAV